MYSITSIYISHYIQCCLIMDKNKFSYKDKINAISSYFGISHTAAKYMYNRRRKGYPYKKESDSSFMKWSVKLQNAFIKADQIKTFTWDDLSFDDDIKQLRINGIDVDEQSYKIHVNKISQTTKRSSKQSNIDGKSVLSADDDDADGGGWIVVTTNKGHLPKRHILRKMGFLPYPNPVFPHALKTKESSTKQSIN
jgi:hypothetical protein